MGIIFFIFHAILIKKISHNDLFVMLLN